MTDYSSMTDDELIAAYRLEKLKETLFENLQSGLKILLNGGYGATGNNSFLYYKLENAAAITASGRLINLYTMKRVNQYLNGMFKTDNFDYLIAGDTDSIYLDLSILWDKVEGSVDDKVEALDQFCERYLTPLIEKICLEFKEYLNAYDNNMEWNREVISESAFWVEKKNYAMLVNNSEGVVYETSDLKVKGLEIIKGSYPQWARNDLKEYVKLILKEKQDDIHQRYSISERTFNKMSLEDIALPSGVSSITKSVDKDDHRGYGKGSYYGAKACIVHNRLIEEKDVKGVRPIKDGDKIKILPLKRVNPLREGYIAFDGKLPKEFGLDNYIDRGKVFNDSFKKPLLRMLNAVGYTERPVETLF